MKIITMFVLGLCLTACTNAKQGKSNSTVSTTHDEMLTWNYCMNRCQFIENDLFPGNSQSQNNSACTEECKQYISSEKK